MSTTRILHFVVILSLLLFLLITGMLFGCQPSNNNLPPTPNIGIPEENYNHNFLITAPAGWNEFKTNKSVGLDIEVIGDYPIEFETDYGAVIFALKKGEWVEIPNLARYPDGTQRLVPANGDYLKHGGVPIAPIVPDETKTTQLRIILVGIIVKENLVTDERVAGIIDIVLNP